MAENETIESGIKYDLEIRLVWQENHNGDLLYPEANKVIEPVENNKLEQWLNYEINIH